MIPAMLVLLLTCPEMPGQVCMVQVIQRYQSIGDCMDVLMLRDDWRSLACAPDLE